MNLGPAVLVTALLLTGCGGPAAGRPAAAASRSAASSVPAADAPASATPAGPPAPPAGCRGTLRDGPLSLPVAGVTRTALLALPRPTGRRRALIIGLHGYDQRAATFDAYTGLRRAGVAQGAVVAVPQGLGSPAGWNVPNSPALGPSDVDLVAALVDRLVTGACVDPHRVVLAGLSDGADQAVTAACALPGRVAAVLLVAASTGPSPSCRAMAVLQVHGTSDPVDAYTGRATDTRRGFGSVKAAGAERALALWSALAACRARTERTNGDLRTLTATSCPGSRFVRLIAVQGGGHTWPGAVPQPALGRTTRSIDTAGLLRTVLDGTRG